jgi:hypothetical protein
MQDMLELFTFTVVVGICVIRVLGCRNFPYKDTLASSPTS